MVKLHSMYQRDIVFRRKGYLFEHDMKSSGGETKRSTCEFEQTARLQSISVNMSV